MLHELDFRAARKHGSVGVDSRRRGFCRAMPEAEASVSRATLDQIMKCARLCTAAASSWGADITGCTSTTHPAGVACQLLCVAMQSGRAVTNTRVPTTGSMQAIPSYDLWSQRSDLARRQTGSSTRFGRSSNKRTAAVWECEAW